MCRTVFFFESIQIEHSCDTVIGRQEDAKPVEDKEETDAEEKWPVGPYRLPEGLGDTESNAGDQVLIVCNHEEHCGLV